MAPGPYLSLLPVSEDLATFEGGNYDHKDAAGFIRLNCLRLGMYAAVQNKLGK